MAIGSAENFFNACDRAGLENFTPDHRNEGFEPKDFFTDQAMDNVLNAGTERRSTSPLPGFAGKVKRR